MAKKQYNARITPVLYLLTPTCLVNLIIDEHSCYILMLFISHQLVGLVVQSVMSLTADPGVASLIPAWSGSS